MQSIELDAKLCGRLNKLLRDYIYLESVNTLYSVDN
jgi:hypothetical protein